MIYVDQQNYKVFIYQIELTVFECVLILVNVLIFLMIIILWKYSDSSKNNYMNHHIILKHPIHLGEGETVNFFTSKSSGKPVRDRKKMSKNGSHTYSKKYQNEEIICKKCKAQFQINYEHIAN